MRRLRRATQGHNLVKELDGWHVRVESTGLVGTGPHGIRIHTSTGRIHDSTAPPILGEGWAAPEPVPDHRTDDVHLQDLPLPEDPRVGWIPDPPDDWLRPDDEMRAA